MVAERQCGIDLLAKQVECRCCVRDPAISIPVTRDIFTRNERFDVCAINSTQTSFYAKGRTPNLTLLNPSEPHRKVMVRIGAVQVQQY